MHLSLMQSFVLPPSVWVSTLQLFPYIVMSWSIAEAKSICSVSGTISIILLYIRLTFNHPQLVNRHVPTFVNALEAPQKSSPSRCENRLWSMNYSRSSGAWALILMVITPCAEDGLAMRDYWEPRPLNLQNAYIFQIAYIIPVKISAYTITYR